MSPKPEDELNALHQRIATLEHLLADRDTELTTLRTRLSRLEVHHQRASHKVQHLRETLADLTRSRSRFLHDLGHDLRTALNPILGLTDLLRESPLTPQQHDLLDMLHTGGRTLLATMSDLLDFVQIEQHVLELEPHPCYLWPTLEEPLELLAPRAAEKRVDLLYAANLAHPAYVEIDTRRLQQVVFALLGTAINLTQRRTLLVAADLRFNTIGPHYSELWLTVRDTGMGLPRDLETRIREAPTGGTYADSSTEAYGSSSLRLFMSKRLLEYMGGSLVTLSGPGKGLLTAFRLPLPHASEPPLPEPTLAPHGVQPALAGKRVLIVDDQVLGRSMLVHYMQQWGMLPVAVDNADAALALVARPLPLAAAVIDLHLTECSGLELVARIRQQPGMAHLPVILLVSFAGEITREQNPMITALLTRPVQPVLLATTLHQVQATEPAAGAATTGDSHPHPGLPQPGELPFLRILLAEDNRMSQRVMLRLLDRFGYTLRVAQNGLEALNMLHNQTFDLVFMDIQMPEMDGVQATRHIRSLLPSERQPRIVAMTARALPGDREYYLSQGMDDYVSKPVLPADLIAVLRSTPPLPDAPRNPPTA